MNDKPLSEKGKPPVAGLAARIVAANLVTRIVNHFDNLDDLTDPDKSNPAFRNLEPRDQALVRAIALTTLRHRTRIEAILKKCWNRKPPQKALFLTHMLEITAAQILFMEIPESAAVNLAVTAIRGEKRSNRFAGFANAVLRTLVRELEKLLEKSAGTSIFPAWMNKALSSDFGREKTRLASQALLREPGLDIHGKPGFAALFPDAIDLPGGGKRLLSDAPVRNLPGFDAGSWWVQDVAAHQPARLLGDVSGKRVADLCAAPGGKTMQLAAAGASVIAVDISEKRLARLRENLERTGLEAEVVCADITEWTPSSELDCILLDAPCSATGTIRRHPDILWNTSSASICELAALQRSLILRSLNFLKPGGILVYANCSIMKEEGENLVASLTAPSSTGGPSSIGARLDPINANEIPGLEVCITGQGTFRSLPHHLSLDPEEKSGMDGFFAARFIRE